MSLSADVDPVTEEFLHLSGESEQVEPPAGRVELHEQVDVARRGRVAAGYRAEDADGLPVGSIVEVDRDMRRTRYLGAVTVSVQAALPQVDQVLVSCVRTRTDIC